MFLRLKKKIQIQIGGTHGDEHQGIMGAKLLNKFFSNEENEFSRKIRSSINIKLIPVINCLGNKIDFRLSPIQNISLAVNENGKIFAKNEEWKDPNRGWDE